MKDRVQPLKSDRDRVLPSETESLARGFIAFLGGPPGEHAIIGRARWWTPLRVLLAVAAGTWVAAWMRLSPCLSLKPGDQGLAFDWSGNRFFTGACYSDLFGLYGSHKLSDGMLPYFNSWVNDEGRTRYMEYPVLAGFFQWIMAFVGHGLETVTTAIGLAHLPEAYYYFLSVGIVSALLWLIAIALMSQLTGNRVWDTLLMAASPVLFVHAMTNFDAISIFFAVWALWLWSRGHTTAVGVVCALGLSFKLWPVLVAVGLVLLSLRAKEWVVAARIMIAGVVTSFIINLPIMIMAPEGWSEFFFVNSNRGYEGSTLYAVVAHAVGSTFLDGGNPTGIVEQVWILNLISTSLMGLGLIALCFLIWKAPQMPRVGQVLFLLVALFLMTNKVWSPQYSLWLVPFMVLALPRWRLVFLWSAVEAVYWYLRLWQFLPSNLASPDWLVDTLTMTRFFLLTVMIIMVIREILGKDVDRVRTAAGGVDPLAGPLAAREEREESEKESQKERVDSIEEIGVQA